MSIYVSFEQLELLLATSSARVLFIITATVLISTLLVQYLGHESTYHTGIPTANLEGSKFVKSLAQARQDWYQFGKQIIDQGLNQVCDLSNILG